MTDDELRAALRRVRLGPPGEWPFRYAPAVIIFAALLVPPVNGLDALGLAACLVAFVWIGLLKWERLHHDRVASRDELCETLHELVAERLRGDRTMYPGIAIALVVVAGCIGFTFYITSGRLITLPLVVGTAFLILLQAAGLVYQHRVRVPEYRRLLDALSAPEPTPVHADRWEGRAL